MMARAERWIGRHWRTGVLLTLLGVVIALAAGLLYVYGLVRQIDGLSTGVTAACKQVRHTGQTCAAKSVPSIKANPAEPTISPVPGPSGAAGRNGKSIVGARIAGCRLILMREDAIEYDAGPVCGPSGSRGPQGSPGPTGSPGVNGTDGQNGANGADGASITGIRCSDTHMIVTISTTGDRDLGAGSCGQGSPGADGEPPYSWTYTGPAGLDYTCSRDDPFDPDKPTYHCQPTPAGSPTP